MPARRRHQGRPPRLARALEAIREGDTLIVWKLDRLGRSVKDLLDFAGRLNERGIGFVSLTRLDRHHHYVKDDPRAG